MIKKILGLAVLGLAIYGAYTIYVDNRPATA